jgi:ubiquitin-conjugating enzyme E2 Q
VRIPILLSGPGAVSRGQRFAVIWIRCRLKATQYEIRANPETVDLLVSLAYNAAAEGVMDKPLPTGLGLRVPLPDSRAQPGSVAPLYLRGGVTLPPADLDIPTKPLTRGRDGLYDFDAMNVHQVRHGIVPLLMCDTMYYR